MGESLYLFLVVVYQGYLSICETLSQLTSNMATIFCLVTLETVSELLLASFYSILSVLNATFKLQDLKTCAHFLFTVLIQL